MLSQIKPQAPRLAWVPGCRHPEIDHILAACRDKAADPHLICEPGEAAGQLARTSCPCISGVFNRGDGYGLAPQEWDLVPFRQFL